MAKKKRATSTPPPDEDEPQYLVVFSPWPGSQLNWKNADKHETCEWLACFVGPDNIYAIYTRRNPSDVILVEISRSVREFRPILGAHTWGKFSRDPRARGSTAQSKVFMAKDQSYEEAVRKRGWEAGKYEPMNLQRHRAIITPYPLPEYCALGFVNGSGYARDMPRPTQLTANTDETSDPRPSASTSASVLPTPSGDPPPTLSDPRTLSPTVLQTKGPRLPSSRDPRLRNNPSAATGSGAPLPSSQLPGPPSAVTEAQIASGVSSQSDNMLPSPSTLGTSGPSAPLPGLVTNTVVQHRGIFGPAPLANASSASSTPLQPPSHHRSAPSPTPVQPPSQHGIAPRSGVQLKRVAQPSRPLSEDYVPPAFPLPGPQIASRPPRQPKLEDVGVPPKTEKIEDIIPKVEPLEDVGFRRRNSSLSVFPADGIPKFEPLASHDPAIPPSLLNPKRELPDEAMRHPVSQTSSVKTEMKAEPSSLASPVKLESPAPALNFNSHIKREDVDDFPEYELLTDWIVVVWTWITGRVKPEVKAEDDPDVLHRPWMQGVQVFEASATVSFELVRSESEDADRKDVIMEDAAPPGDDEADRLLADVLDEVNQVQEQERKRKREDEDEADFKRVKQEPID